MSKGSILVADDDSAIRIVINQALTRAGYEVRVASGIESLWKMVSDGDGDVVVSDVIMPDGDAFGLLPRIKNTRPDLPVILISAQNTFMTAVKSQEAGAYDYLPKPFDLDELIRVVERAVNAPRDDRPAQSFEDYIEDMPLVGRSSAIQEIYRSIARLMHSDLPVLLSGEAGTGKRLTARVLHDFGDRKSNAFVPVNLAALPAELVEGELFGRQGGNGKTEAGLLKGADGGTLFLDEIGELPPAAQSRLLHVLLRGEFIPVGGTVPLRIDARIISSSTKDLDRLVQEGKFREDLFYRLNVVPMWLPPLRHRIDDIADLARHFIRISELEGAQTRHFDGTALKVLKAHSWPGNIRELENLVHRICILHPQETITGMIVESEIRNRGGFSHGTDDSGDGGFSGLREATEYFLNHYYAEYPDSLPPDGVYQKFLEEFEYPVIVATLAATNGNQIRAAKVLGLNRNTLRKKIKNLGIRITRMAR